MTDSNIIGSDHPLSPPQQARVVALADTLLPASADGRLPSAATLDFTGHVQRATPELLPTLADFVDRFDDGFAEQDITQRVAQVQALSATEPEPFAELIFALYSCYYQDPGVQVAIGMEPGAPFPQGNSIDPGDLSLLDPVMANRRGYRRTTPG